MKFFLSLLGFMFLQFYSVDGLLKNLATCGTTIAAAASPAPTKLSDIAGFWYIYQTNTPSRWFPDIRCGKCVIQATSDTAGKLRCVVEVWVLDPPKGIYTIKHRSFHLDATYTAATGTLAFKGGNFDSDLRIIKWDSHKKCEIAVSLCDYISVGGIFELKSDVQIALVRKAPLPTTALITAPQTAIEYKECKLSELDPAAALGDTLVFAPTTDRPNKKIPETCTDLGFTKVDSRFVKFYAGPKKWQEAKDFCSAQGFNLALADTAAIVTAIKGMNLEAEAWIGLKQISQSATEGTYQWCATATAAAKNLAVTLATGKGHPTSDYTGFAQDSDYDKTGLDANFCMALPAAAAANYGWIDKDCDLTAGFLCECIMCS